MDTVSLPKDHRGFVLIGGKESVREDFLINIIERRKLGKLSKNEKHSLTFDLSVPYSDFRLWLKEGRVWQG